MRGVSIPFGFNSDETHQEEHHRVCDALEQWFNRQPTGFFFKLHVIALEANPSGQFELCVSELDPYMQRLVLVYELARVASRIHIVGSIDTMSVLEKHGQFQAHDLRASLETSVIPVKRVEEEENNAPECFYFPHGTGRKLPNVSLPQLQSVVQSRVSWLLACWSEGTHKLFPLEMTRAEDALSFAATHMIGLCMETLLHIPNSSCNVYQARISFERVRMQAERFHFLRRFSHFRSPSRVQQLLSFNGLDSTSCDILPLDRQSFLDRYPNQGMPVFFTSIPLEEAPDGVVQHLPLHSDGTIHLSHLDVAPWIWNRYDIYYQRETTLLPVERLTLPWLREEAQRIFLHVTTSKRVVVNSLRGGNEPLEIIDPDVGYSVEVKDMLEMLPLCLRSIATSRFPRNMERLVFVQTFMAAGVSYLAVQRFFENLNDRYPKDGGQPLTIRFGLETVWKRNYGPLYCNSILQKTAAVSCPFVAETQNDNVYANSCHCRLDGDMPDVEDMYAPHMYLKYHLTKGRGKHKATRVEPVETPLSPFGGDGSSDDSSLEEEW